MSAAFAIFRACVGGALFTMGFTHHRYRARYLEWYQSVNPRVDPKSRFWQLHTSAGGLVLMAAGLGLTIASIVDLVK